MLAAGGRGQSALEVISRRSDFPFFCQKKLVSQCTHVRKVECETEKEGT